MAARRPTTPRAQGTPHPRQNPRLELTTAGKVVVGLIAVVLCAVLAFSGFMFVRAMSGWAVAAASAVMGGSEDKEQQEPGIAPVKARGPSNTTGMEHVQRITGEIRPKSVVADGHGTVIANNMIYKHTLTVYDAGAMGLVKTVPDTVNLAEFGYPEERAGKTQGAPVEAAFSADGKYAYVTQYGLTGPGSGAPSTDKCKGGDEIGRSAIFRLNMSKHVWDQVIEVGRVPKFISISPDGSTAIVSNWCDSSVSVVDLAKGKEIKQIPVDEAPRGSVILADNRTAYVTAMYANELYRLDLVEGTSKLVMKTGKKPRHLVLSPDGKRMYLTESGSDRLRVLDPTTGEVIEETRTGREPRSMSISADGTALYVVNYYANSMSKFDAHTLKELQRVKVGVHPVGVAYEPVHKRVWVANYNGSIDVFNDNAAPSKDSEGAAQESSEQG